MSGRWSMNGWIYENSLELNEVPSLDNAIQEDRRVIGTVTNHGMGLGLGLQSPYLLGSREGVNTTVDWWLSKAKLRDFNNYQLGSYSFLPAMSEQVAVLVCTELYKLANRCLQFLPGAIRYDTRKREYWYVVYPMFAVFRDKAYAQPTHLRFITMRGAVEHMFNHVGVNDAYLRQIDEIVNDN